MTSLGTVEPSKADDPDRRAPVSSLRGGRIIAASTFRDTARRRSSWTITLLTGVLFALLVVGAGAVSERTQERAEAISFRVVVGGDRDGGRALIDRLATDRLRIELVANPDTEVAENRATVGIRLPDRVDQRLSQGEQIEFPMYFRGGSNVSREALNTLLLHMQELEPAQADVIDVGPAVTVEERQVRRDERVNRLQFAPTLAALATILCLGVVSSVAAVLGRSRERRSLEPLLLLPFSRLTVATSTTLGALPVAVLQLVAAVGLLIAAAALPLLGLNLSWASIAPILLISVVGVSLLGALACAVGCFAGVLGSGSDDGVSLGDFLSLPFVAVGLLLFLQPTMTSAPLAFAVPIVGPALLLRDGAAGTLALPNALLAIASTALWCWLLTRLSARRLEGDRIIARTT